MQTESETYELHKLVELSGVTPRTIRFYIQQGILNSPRSRGPGSRYDRSALAKLKLIRRWQRVHLPLAEIRRRLAGMSDRDVLDALASSERGSGESVSDAATFAPRGALDSLEGEAFVAPSLASSEPDEVSTLPFVRNDRADERDVGHIGSGAGIAPAPTRSTWERHTIVADVEVHVRRPLTRDVNRRLERLLQQARDIFDEGV